MGRKRIVLIFGPPGAGKSTQAILVAEKFDLYYLETSKIIEKHLKVAKEGDYEVVEGKKYFLLEEKKLWESGILNTPELVTFWVIQEIKRLSEKDEGIVMGGSPRTLYEAQKELPVLKEEYGLENISIFLLNLSPEQSIFRNSHRRICELLRHPIIYNEETKNLTLCPLDGSRLVKRGKLDDPETIKVRLKEYKERTLPLLKYLEEEGLRIFEIDGGLTVEEIFKRISSILENNGENSFENAS